MAEFCGACTKSEKPFLISEFFPLGSLRSVVDQWRKVGPATETNVDYSLLTSLSIDACEAVAFLHHNNIIHRDLKPANFLVSEHLEAKLIDFGVSRVMQADNLKMTKIGTPIWMAPEVRNKS
jgi:serine/threonine protein kinase